MNRPKLTYVGPSLRRREGLFYEPRIGRMCGPFPSADATAVMSVPGHRPPKVGREAAAHAEAT